MCYQVKICGVNEKFNTIPAQGICDQKKYDMPWNELNTYKMK